MSFQLFINEIWYCAAERGLKATGIIAFFKAIKYILENTCSQCANCLGGCSFLSENAELFMTP